MLRKAIHDAQQLVSVTKT